ncbi:MAG: hypothetical protein IPL61_04930 [Myxococcales bacterium]|nr:hypothetical protein [Myxococcales bacterium]
MRTWWIGVVTAGLVGTVGVARANQPCGSDGITTAAADGPTAMVPVNCPVEFYVGANVPRPLAVFRNGVEVTGFPFADGDGFEVTRDRSVCSSVDPTCWTWIRDARAVSVVGYTPGTPFQAGDVVGLGTPGDQPWATITIGAPDSCPPRRSFSYEMCADPLGGACTGGAFTCDADGGVDSGADGDAGLVCDGGGSAHDPTPDGDGCAAGGGADAGAALALLGLVAVRRRRR